MPELAKIDNGRFKVHVRQVMSSGGMGDLADHQIAINPYGLPEGLRARFLERAKEIEGISVTKEEARFMASAISRCSLHTLGRLLAEYSVVALPVDTVIEVLRDYL